MSSISPNRVHELRWFGHVTRMFSKDWPGMSCWMHQRESVPKVVQGPCGMDNGQWFIASYDSANKQKHYKKSLH